MNEIYFIFIAAALFMAYMLFHASRKFLNLLAAKHPDTYNNLGKPDVIKDFKKFLTYIKSKDYFALEDEEIDSLGQVINFLYLAGITLLSLTAIVLLILFIK